MLLEKIKQESLVARKAREAVCANLLGIALAEIQNAAKADGGREPTDADAEKVIRSLQKRNAQARDLKDTDQLQAEATVLNLLVPPINMESLDLGLELMRLIADNGDKYQAAKENSKLRGWFRGQLMKLTGGKADAAELDRVMDIAFT